MLNQFADKMLSAILPHETAAAPCGPYRLVACTLCAGGRIYYKKCRDCTGGGSGSGCTPCDIVRTC